MARVQVDDETWREFRAVAGYRPISELLGELVEREVRRARSTRLRAGTLTGRELVEALARARDQAEDLQAIVTRLELLREPESVHRSQHDCSRGPSKTGDRRVDSSRTGAR